MGSSRIPALQNGVFGFRPSTGLVDSEGLVKAWPAMDTPALLGRNLMDFPEVMQVLSARTAKIRAESKPTQILYAEDFIPEENTEQSTAIIGFLEDLIKANMPSYLISGSTFKETGRIQGRSAREVFTNTFTT